MAMAHMSRLQGVDFHLQRCTHRLIQFCWPFLFDTEGNLRVFKLLQVLVDSKPLPLLLLPPSNSRYALLTRLFRSSAKSAQDYDFRLVWSLLPSLGLEFSVEIALVTLCFMIPKSLHQKTVLATPTV